MVAPATFNKHSRPCSRRGNMLHRGLAIALEQHYRSGLQSRRSPRSGDTDSAGWRNAACCPRTDHRGGLEGRGTGAELGGMTAARCTCVILSTRLLRPAARRSAPTAAARRAAAAAGGPREDEAANAFSSAHARWRRSTRTGVRVSKDDDESVVAPSSFETHRTTAELCERLRRLALRCSSACSSERVLILRSVHARWGRDTQISVCASRWMRTSARALMFRDASPRSRAVEAPARRSRCDAPQHEGNTRKRAAERVFASLISSQLRQASAKLWPMCWRALGLRHGRSDGGNQNGQIAYRRFAGASRV